MISGYQTIRFRREQSIGYLQFHRPEANNAINDTLIEECRQVLATHGPDMTVLILEGLPSVFLFGADFQAIHQQGEQGLTPENAANTSSPEALYELWLDLATGPYVTVAQVRGRANAGGIGFVAACDIVLAEPGAAFSLSELLFGLYPACVLPFLIRRIGHQRAHYMTLMTQPIPAETALAWGLVDAIDASSDELLRKHLLRLRRLSKKGIQRYKRYMAGLDPGLAAAQASAVAGNREVFADPENLADISRYVQTGQFPWEKGRR